MVILLIKIFLRDINISNAYRIVLMCDFAPDVEWEHYKFIYESETASYAVVQNTKGISVFI